MDTDVAITAAIVLRKTWDWKQRSQDRTKGLSESIEPELVDFQITEPHTRNESFQADVDSERRDTGE